MQRVRDPKSLRESAKFRAVVGERGFFEWVGVEREVWLGRNRLSDGGGMFGACKNVLLPQWFCGLCLASFVLFSEIVG